MGGKAVGAVWKRLGPVCVLKMAVLMTVLFIQPLTQVLLLIIIHPPPKCGRVL